MAFSNTNTAYTQCTITSASDSHVYMRVFFLYASSLVWIYRYWIIICAMCTVLGHTVLHNILYVRRCADRQREYVCLCAPTVNYHHIASNNRPVFAATAQRNVIVYRRDRICIVLAQYCCCCCWRCFAGIVAAFNKQKQQQHASSTRSCCIWY